MPKTFKLQVVTPERQVLSEEVTEVVLPGGAGEFGALAGHMPLLSSLRPGRMIILKGLERELYFVSGGYAEVNPQSVTVLAESLEKADEIDSEAALKSRKHAEEMLAQRPQGLDLEHARTALVRATARLEVLEEFRSAKK
jgi:F-type H+-transporting ATPase subunit epsilon